MSELSKAQILNLDKQGTPGIPVMFNPKELSLAKTNQWSMNAVKGSNVPQLDFGGGKPATLTLELFFDTYKGTTSENVLKTYTEALWDLMLVDDSLKDPKSKKSRPPKVRFIWGKLFTFDAVITSITQKVTMFLADGTPVRATLQVSFQQIKDAALYPSQNPTSGGIGGERMWEVREGDTLSGIAYAEYGDPGKWRPIADFNKLSNVRRLKPGQFLAIPNA
jgi:hypothetical protein